MPRARGPAPWPALSSILAVFLCLSSSPPLASAKASRRLRAQHQVTQPNYGIYHHKAELLKEVQDIVAANPKTMQIEVKHAEDKGYAVDMQVVTVALGGLDTNSSSRARILMDFGEHGREYISSELGLQLLHTLADPEAVKAVLGGGARGDALMAQLQHVVFVILPLENVGGRDRVEGGKLCERKNGRGVDTNRNWAVDWGKKEPDYDPAEEFPGAGPFSEPEAQIILGLARMLQPHVWLNVHSGMEAMFTPWDHVATVPPEAQEALRILKTIHKDLFTSECVVGSGGKSVGYLAHGTATDYMFERLKVPMAYTWEIYGDMKAPFSDCFRMFNPLTQEHVDRVIAIWMKAIFRMVELMPSHPVIAAQQLFLAKGTTTSHPSSKGSEGPPSSRPGSHAPKPAGSHSTQPGMSTPGSTKAPTSTPTTSTASTTLPPASSIATQPPTDEPNVEPFVETKSTPGGLGPLSQPLLQEASNRLWGQVMLGAAGVAVVGVFVYRFYRKSGDAGAAKPEGKAGAWA